MDTSSRSDFVTVNSVRLHYLDWGGSGEVLLLLTGFGDDALIFDGFAQEFTDRFHVIGLTRRGFGQSDKPPTGYDTATRVEDLHHFLDAMKLKRANIVGHSLAGDELTLFASKYPERVKKLVYLDAAYYRKQVAELTLGDPTTPAFLRRLFLELQDASDAAQIMVTDMPPPEDWERYKAIMKALITFEADYSGVKAPALAFYAIPEHHPYVPPETADEDRKKMDDWWTKNAIPYIKASIEQFRRETQHGQVVELKDARHYLFLGPTQAVVVEQMREFLSK